MNTTTLNTCIVCQKKVKDTHTCTPLDEYIPVSLEDFIAIENAIEARGYTNDSYDNYYTSGCKIRLYHPTKDYWIES